MINHLLNRIVNPKEALGGHRIKVGSKYTDGGARAFVENTDLPEPLW